MGDFPARIGRADRSLEPSCGCRTWVHARRGGYPLYVQVCVDIAIERPREVVFEAFCDIDRAAGRRRGVKQVDVITPGPFGLGTRWRQTRGGLAHPMQELWVTRLDRGRMYRVEAETAGVHYVSDVSFADDGDDRTLVHLEYTGTPLTRGARIRSLADALAASSARRMLRRDLSDMRKALEA
jgi:hypothetical protein